MAKPLENEPLSAPVVVNNQIYITDTEGYLYSFSDEKGTQLAITLANATNPPVFDGKFLLVNTVSDFKKGVSFLTVFNPNTLKKEKVFENLMDSSYSNIQISLTSSELMCYSRNRIFMNNGTYYQINSKGLQAFSGSEGTVKWSLPIASNLSFNPVLAFAGKYLLASTHNTKLALIDMALGQKVKEYYVSEIISSEPAIANGWIYCGTKNSKLIAINSKDKAITGWNQWGMNAGHNPIRFVE